MSKPPAFQFYANDFVAGTSRLTTSETGGYVLLLCEQWDKGGVPGDNIKALAQVMRCTPSTARSIWAQVKDKFVCGPDGEWRNERLEKVRAEQEEYRAKKRDGGQKGAAARWHKDSPGTSKPMADPLGEPLENTWQTDDPPVSSLQSSSSEKNVPVPGSVPARSRSIRRDATALDDASPQALSPCVLTFPCDGPTPTWALTEAQVATWAGQFASVDVEDQCRRALAWIEASPQRRKTARGMPKFLVGWLGRAVDSRRGTSGGSPKTAGNLDALRRFAAREV